MIIKVENLPRKSSKNEVKNLFKKYGKVSSIVIRDESAYVRMKKSTEAERAIEHLNGEEWNGNALILTEEQAKPESSICRTEHGVFNLI